MPTLSIKNVPQTVVDGLRARAQRNHRSMQGELMALVCQAVERGDGPAQTPWSVEPGTVPIESIAAEHRQRRDKPVTQGPRAVDIIRADRDAR
ncbi:MAG: Arc family DNA-binding protein [Gammaproteobacteria bacterium]|nr:Arc family DNA-binding protein [Gammaproteobacteria bacterium]